MYPAGYIEGSMAAETELQSRAEAASAAFGTAIRGRRVAAGMTQDQLALATGVGRRFLIDLEAGKASCYLGLGLLVAEALGLRLSDAMRRSPSPESDIEDLPPPSP